MQEFAQQGQDGRRGQPTPEDCYGGSHFDERTHYTEIMGAVFSQSVNVVSPLTLAFLEDSGWYRASYLSEYVRVSPFGHRSGCSFVEDGCLDEDGSVPSALRENFCDSLISVKESGDQTCDP